MLRAWFLLYLSLPLVKMKYDIEKTNADPFYYCMRTYNVSREQVDLFTEDIDAAFDDYKLHCYIGCVMEMTGLLSYCELNPSSFYIKGGGETIHGLDTELVDEIIEECYGITTQNKNPCACGYAFAKCMQRVVEGFQNKKSGKALETAGKSVKI